MHGFWVMAHLYWVRGNGRYDSGTWPVERMCVLESRWRLVRRPYHEACADRRPRSPLFARALPPDRKDLSRSRDARVRRGSVRNSVSHRQVHRDRQRTWALRLTNAAAHSFQVKCSCSESFTASARVRSSQGSANIDPSRTPPVPLPTEFPRRRMPPRGRDHRPPFKPN
jgi:hypothetical protein